jgi:hypothetical protein
MVLKPRWVVPLNFRFEDKPLLDSVVLLAKKEELNLTGIIRDALLEYTRKRLDLCETSGTHKIDEFVGTDLKRDFPSGILTREELKTWKDSDLLDVAKSVRARKQELEIELRKRGYHFIW